MDIQFFMGVIALALIISLFGFIATRTPRDAGSPRRNLLYAWPRTFGKGTAHQPDADSTPTASPAAPIALADLSRRRDEAGRIAMMRAGIPTSVRGELADALGWSPAHLDEVLRIAPETTLATPSESERFLLLHDLLLEVAAMVQRSGNPENFDAGRWLGRWLDEPNPALGARPAHWLDTCAGCFMVANVLACMESGAYR